jgi:GT2 family glycosyltransferase
MASEPLVSIVIPVYNRSSVTKSCLTSLQVSGTMLLEPEIVVADDASGDDTIDVAESFPGVRVVSNPYNVGFIRNCNRAAATAAGKYLVFLNNDTIVFSGWLEWLVATADERPSAGAVGSKILLTDGRLSEAGLLIARDGVGHEYGFGSNADAPRFNYVRPVDFNGGCSLLVRRELFYAIGGFAERYAPAYMDDFDLGLSVWERGFQCVYQPRSAVMHVNFMTHGTERSDALYRLHRPRFLRRWGDEIARQPAVSDVPGLESASLEAAVRHRCGSRAVLVVDDRPYAPHVRRELLAHKAAGTHVAFAPLGALHLPQRRDLQQAGIEVLYAYGSRSLEDAIFETLPSMDEVIFPGNHFERFARAEAIHA